MSRPAIQGFPQSSYVWSARAAFAVAGVDVDFQAIEVGDHKKPDHLSRHPMGKVPTLTHGDLTLFEAAAVMTYADGLAGKPVLFPTDPAGRARVAQWFSVVNCYLYSAVVPDWFFASQRGAPEEALADARSRAETVLRKLEDDIDGPWIVGDSITAADLIVGPMLFLMTRLEGGPEILAKLPKVQALQGALARTQAFMDCAYKG